MPADRSSTDPVLFDLTAELRTLGRALELPDTELTDAVMARLVADPVPAIRWWSSRPMAVLDWLRRRWRAAVAVLIGGLIVVGVGTPVGAAVGRWFGIGGVVIDAVPPDSTDPIAPGMPLSSAGTSPAAGSTPSVVSAGTSKASGGSITQKSAAESLTIDRAAAMVGFAPLLPTELGAPDRIEVSADHRVLSLHWTGGPDGPLRLDEFAGSPSPVFYKKYAGEVQGVEVAGEEAIWLPKPHELIYVDADQREHTESARTAAQTLVWLHGSLTLRLEGGLTKARALQIAETVIE